MDGALDRSPTLRACFAIQRRVIGALMLRELVTRFGRHNLGALWLFVEPMLFTLGVAAVWHAAGLKRSSAIPIIAFAITGYSTVLLWRNTVSRCIGAIHSNLNLLFHRNVKVLDVLVARSLLEVGGASASFVVLTVVFVSFEAIGWPRDLLRVLFGWGMLTWFGIALSVTVGAATAFTPIIERIWQPVGYILFPLSGAAFMADWLSPGLRDALLWLPMVHSVEFIREGYFGDIMRYHYSMSYMALCNLGLTLTAVWLAREAGRNAEAE